MYLMSQFTNTQSFAKISHFQEVAISSIPNNLTSWEIEHFNPKVRFEMQGEVVRAGEPVLIKHVHTGKWLGTDNIPVKTMYGVETEVFTESVLARNKS